MDELERRLRDANPGKLRRGGPLTPRGLQDLAAITGMPADEITHGSPRRSAPLWSIAASVAVLTAGAIAVAGIFNPMPASAIPPLLSIKPLAGSEHEIIAELSMTAREHHRDVDFPATVRYESWSATLTVTGDTTDLFVQPEDVELTRDADGSGRILVRAGALRWGGPKDSERAAMPGEILRDTVYRPGEFPALFPEAPPSTADSLRDYFETTLGLDESATAGDYFTAVHDLRSEWELDGEQSAAVIDMLAQLTDVKVAGLVVDRLGREGIALAAQTRHHGAFRDVLIFSQNTGSLLSSETEYLGGIEEITVPYPTVMNYIAWKETNTS